MNNLTDRQKISHLLRRFGFGASTWEMEEFVPLGVRGTVDRLLDFSVSKDLGDPLRYAFKKDEDAEPGGYRFRLHWALQMVTTRTPLREKLALFWHDHFAVNEDNVSHGIAMLDYMERIRRNPAGKFADILTLVGKSPAVMRELNVELFSRLKPNENYARELMELYTLGEGNGYTEKDVKEVARALTGWGHLDVFWALGKTNNERLENMRRAEVNPVLFVNAPEVNIPGKKRVLGQDLEDGDDVIALLAKHPQTAKFICEKLWGWFAGKNPSEKVISRLSKRFIATDGNIALVLREMAEMDEFYATYRQLIKNPFDYVVGLVRAQNGGPRFIKELEAEAEFTKPMADDVFTGCGEVIYWADQVGMGLFLPQSVAGWDWHEGWTSTSMLIRRKDFTGCRTWYPVEQAGKETEWHPDLPVQYVIGQIRKRNPADLEALVNAFCTVYDCSLSPDQQAVLVKHFEKNGGLGMMSNDRHFGWICTTALNLLGSAPEFQLC